MELVGVGSSRARSWPDAVVCRSANWGTDSGESVWQIASKIHVKEEARMKVVYR